MNKIIQSFILVPPCSGLTRADGQLAFRVGHPVTLKNGMDVHKPPPPLPSDNDPQHIYGAAPDYRSREQIRVAGRAPPLRSGFRVQGSRFKWHMLLVYAYCACALSTCASISHSKLEESWETPCCEQGSVLPVCLCWYV